MSNRPNILYLHSHDTGRYVQPYGHYVLTPNIQQALGLSIGALGIARVLQFLATVVAPLPMAKLSEKRGRRAMLCITTGVAWSVITLFTGFVTSLLGLIVVLCLDGLTTGSVTSLHSPLIVDNRVRPADSPNPTPQEQ